MESTISGNETRICELAATANGPRISFFCLTCKHMNVLVWEPQIVLSLVCV